MEAFDLRGRMRTKSFFGFDWQFALTDSACMPGTDTVWRSVQLPHDWSVDYPVDERAPSCGSGGYARTGIGWYRRSFRLYSQEKQRVALLFDGVYMNCDLWVNGQHAGGHVYGYTSFMLDLTALVRNGENELLVRVDNSHQPGSRWYSGSGITRDVWLLGTPDTCIAPWGVFVSAHTVTQEWADMDVEVRTVAPGTSRPLTVTADVLLDGATCACAEPVRLLSGQSTHLSIRLEQPALWDTAHPSLYTAWVRLGEGGKLIDQISVRFGVRNIAYDAQQGFLLNGRKVLLRGVCLHHDGGCVGAAVPREIWARRLRKLKAMGCNALRCSHNPPDPVLLDLADEMGLMVMDEAFDEWQMMKGKEFGSNTHASRGYSEWFDACWQDDMTAMVLRDRNHPCIIMWSIGNEIREQVDENGWRVARRLAGLCHALDPTRPITAACDQVKAEPLAAKETFLQELDLVGVNYTDRWRDRTETFFDEEKQEHPAWPLLGTEDVSVGGVRGEYSLSDSGSPWGRSTYAARMLKAEKLWKYVSTRRFVIGDFMWTGVDYLGECFWPDKGASSGVLDTCGFEKDGYYFYQSQWVKDRPVMHVFPNLNMQTAPGTVIPVVVYTNCFTVELLVNGRSWGVKAYEFPAQGMTQHWPHFDHPSAPVTTGDLHLSWDVPFDPADTWLAIGRDSEGREVIRREIRRAGHAASLQVTADRSSIPSDGRSVAQLEISLLDAAGNLAVEDDREITVQVEGGALLGMDNGSPRDHTLYQAGYRKTFHGLAYAVVRKDGTDRPLEVRLCVPGLEEQRLCIPVETIRV